MKNATSALLSQRPQLLVAQVQATEWFIVKIRALVWARSVGHDGQFEVWASLLPLSALLSFCFDQLAFFPSINWAAPWRIVGSIAAWHDLRLELNLLLSILHCFRYTVPHTWATDLILHRLINLDAERLQVFLFIADYIRGIARV